MEKIGMVDEAFLLARIGKMGKGGGSGDGPSREEFNQLKSKVDQVEQTADGASEAAAEALSTANDKADLEVTEEATIATVTDSDHRLFVQLVEPDQSTGFASVSMRDPEGNLNGLELQRRLVDGETLKTVNGDSLLGEGNIEIGDIYFITLESTSQDIYAAVTGGKSVAFKSSGVYPVIVFPVSDSKVYVTIIEAIERGNVLFNLAWNTHRVEGASWTLEGSQYVVPTESEGYAPGAADGVQIGSWLDPVDNLRYPIYRKTVEIGQLPNAASTSKNHGIPKEMIKHILNIYGTASTEDHATNMPLPLVTNDPNKVIYVSVGGTKVTVTTHSDRSNLTDCWVTFEYVKHMEA